jgi:hypothetical protein
MNGQGEASTVTGLADGFEAAGHAFGIAVGATGADFGATGDGVPSGFSPLYGRALCQGNSPSM